VIDRLPGLVNADPVLVRRGRHFEGTVLIEVGAVPWLVSVRAGRIDAVEKGPHVMRPWRFAVRAAEATWRRFWAPVPAPGDHDIFALLRKGEMRFEGDIRALMAHLLYFKLVLASPRAPAEA
jgi:hypothetical protein